MKYTPIYSLKYFNIMKRFRFTDTQTGEYFTTQFILPHLIHNYELHDVDFANWLSIPRILTYTEI